MASSASVWQSLLFSCNWKKEGSDVSSILPCQEFSSRESFPKPLSTLFWESASQTRNDCHMPCRGHRHWGVPRLNTAHVRTCACPYTCEQEGQFLPRAWFREGRHAEGVCFSACYRAQALEVDKAGFGGRVILALFRIIRLLCGRRGRISLQTDVRTLWDHPQEEGFPGVSQPRA